jgi:hypothetical protein
VPPIDKIEQKTETGFGSEDDRIDVKTFTDPANTNDFYMTRYQTNINAIPAYGVTDDEFFQGNQVFDLYLNPDIKQGDVIAIRLYGISEQYFNYMSILTSIVGGGDLCNCAGYIARQCAPCGQSQRFGFGLFQLVGD